MCGNHGWLRFAPSEQHATMLRSQANPSSSNAGQKGKETVTTSARSASKTQDASPPSLDGSQLSGAES